MFNVVKATRAKYNALAEKDADALYFITDESVIYQGADLYTKAVETYTTEGGRPSAGAANRLYVNTDTLEAHIWDGAAYVQVAKPYATAIADVDTHVPTSKAVKTYVDEAVAGINNAALTDVSYNEETKVLSVTKAGTTTTKTIKGVVTGMTYSNGVLTATDVAGTEVASLNLELERYLRDAYYDEAAHKLVFEMNVEGQAETTKIEIPAEDFVTLIDATDSSTVDLTMTAVTGAANKLTAAVKVSAVEGNLITAKDDGLYVAPVDLSGKMDLVATPTANNILAVNAAGQAVDSGKSVGGATLAATKSENVVASEAAVDTAITAAKTETLNTVSTTYATKEELKTATDDLAAVKENYVKTEDVVATLDEARKSTTKVASEAAVVAALSWKTL